MCLTVRVYHILFQTAGIVETGLFVGMAKVAYFGSADGSVKTVQGD